MKIFGSAHSSIKELSERVKQLAKNLVSPFYRAKSEKYWNFYKEFCKKFDLDVGNPLEEGKEDFRKSLAITQVLRARKKISVSAIGSVVKRFAEHVGMNDKFTAYSLQIRGATVAMTTGLESLKKWK
ncbi:1025_t:CDS:2 [Cetraspora pellucida]|uniref:1025_t:CDS:1 n=1 Tax=Cetraspora pellucida TaxID=1433469 RepID=A0A9N8YV52_9GLOM|nr:1025_t:CDS:2 [Cetraspora pellucida]